MNVLHINSYEKAGGAEQVATDLLRIPGVNSSLIVKGKSSDNPQVQVLERNNLDRALDLLDRLMFKLKYNNSFRALFSIGEQFNFSYQKLRRTRVYQEADIIHLHNIHGYYFDLKALIPIAMEKPIVWTMHDMWPLTGGEFYTYDNLNFQKGIGKTPIAYLAPLAQPWIDRRQHFLQLKRRIYNRIKGSITFVPVSNWLAQQVNAAYVMDEGHHIQTIHNGYDSSKFFNRQIRTWEVPRVLFFNQSGQSKASHLFTQGLQSAPDFELYVVGAPIDDRRVKYHSRYIQGGEALSELYNSVDILVFPSCAETFGLIPLEAMACGVCVIAADATALPEIVSTEDGYLFQSGDMEELFEQLERALSSLSDTRAMGEKAALRVLHTFSLTKTHEAYYNLYRQLLNTQANAAKA